VPAEGLCQFLIMSLDKATNRLLQFANTGKNATVQSAAFQLNKPALHGIQPRGAGWSEVKLEPGMFFQPSFHFWRFVSRAIIQNSDEDPALSVFLDQFVAENRETL